MISISGLSVNSSLAYQFKVSFERGLKQWSATFIIKRAILLFFYKKNNRQELQKITALVNFQKFSSLFILPVTTMNITAEVRCVFVGVL